MIDRFTELTLGRGIRAAALRWPDKSAIIADNGELTYRQLSRRIARAANAAAALGANRGDRVALIAQNCKEYHEVVVGLSDAGVIVVTLSNRLVVAELMAIFEDCLPVAVIIGGSCEAGRMAAEAAGLRLIALGVDWDALLERSTETPYTGARESETFGLAYTSGTTGAPKGVMLSHRSRALTFMAMAVEYGCFGADDRFLAVTPMAHGAGFVFGSAPLFFGGTVVLTATGDPEAILARVREGDITGVFMVPTHFSRMAELPGSAFAWSHRLRAIISNAASLAQPLKEMAVARFGQGLLHETYGSTEAGIVTNIRPDEILVHPGSVGTAFPLIELSLRTDNGTEAASCEPGELFVRGPYAFNGYWRQDEATCAACQDGWVTVGDMATRCGDGFITITDRKSDLIISGGLNIYPREIERVVLRLPGVREVAVVGVPDPEWGERPHIFIVGDDHLPDLATISSACRAELAGYKIPRSMSVIAELPRNASGKIIKRALRDTVEVQTLATLKD